MFFRPFVPDIRFGADQLPRLVDVVLGDIGTNVYLVRKQGRVIE